MRRSLIEEKPRFKPTTLAISERHHWCDVSNHYSKEWVKRRLQLYSLMQFSVANSSDALLSNCFVH